MDSEPFVDRVAGLDEDEIVALCRAATWYAKYHAGSVAAGADQMTAYAVEQREQYRTLLGALAKLGVRIPVPAEIASALERHAA